MLWHGLYLVCNYISPCIEKGACCVGFCKRTVCYDQDDITSFNVHDTSHQQDALSLLSPNEDHTSQAPVPFSCRAEAHKIR